MDGMWESFSIPGIPEGGCVANGGKEEIVLRFTFAHDL